MMNKTNTTAAATIATVSMPINTRQAWRPVLKPIGRLLIAAHLALALQPLSVLAQDKGATPFNPQAQAQLQRLGQLNQTLEQAKASKAKQNQSPADKVSDKLARVHELTQGLGRGGTAARTAVPDNKRQERLTELRELLKDVRDDAAVVRAEFNATRAELQKKNLPAEILARHDEAVAQFEQRAAQFVQIADKANDDDKVRELDGFFKKYPAKKRHTPMDPGKLPWGSPKATPRMPAETKTAWYQQLTKDHKVQLAQAGTTTIGGVRFTHPPEPTQAPQDADLAENPDVQFTPAIRAKALELGNNPLNIYNWVRNNVQWLPTWGSIQGADGTLRTLRGNAFDTASLTIALLRASGIPARYQFGTIDVPSAQVMNWIGGVQRPEAALNLLYQGGIAARGVAGAGQLGSIRMEHVWVNAYVNWTPSRGAKDGGPDLTPKQHPNPNAGLNAWTPIDASFKQYVYTQGMNLQSAVPFDVAALVAAAQQGATVTPNYVQNLNQANLQTRLTGYQNHLKAYIDSTPTGASSTVGDVLGSQRIQTRTFALLPGALPYQTTVQGNERAEVPDSLKWKWRIKLFSDDNAVSAGSESLAIELPASKVAGKKVTLSFTPATLADQQTIKSHLPTLHADGSPIQPSELLETLPGYLIRLKAEIRLDGQLVASQYTSGANPTAQSWQLGTELASRAGFFNPKAGQWEDAELNRPIAGETIATAFDLQGIGRADLKALDDRLTVTQSRLRAFQGNPSNVSVLAGVTKEEVFGDLLYASALSYFAAVQTAQELTARSGNQIANRLPSFGNFQNVAVAAYSWGVPRKVSFGPMQMDMDRLAIQASPKTWSDLADEANQRTSTLRQLGAIMSAYEHIVPEQLFGKDPTNPSGPGRVTGFSAAKILALAGAQGIKIYTFTDKNQPDHQAMLSQMAVDSAVREEITSALDRGFEISIPDRSIIASGFVGTGYVITDLATGAAAWKVSGGSNGAFISKSDCSSPTGFSGGVGSYFVGIYDGVQHMFDREGNEAEKAQVTEILLGNAIYLYGTNDAVRGQVNQYLLDHLDFVAGKILAGIAVSLMFAFIGFGAGGLPGAAAGFATGTVMQIFSTLGYLLGKINGDPSCS